MALSAGTDGRLRRTVIGVAIALALVLVLLSVFRPHLASQWVLVGPAGRSSIVNSEQDCVTAVWLMNSTRPRAYSCAQRTAFAWGW